MKNDFNQRNNNSLSVTPNAVAAPLSPTQVAHGQNVQVVASATAQADNPEDASDEEIIGS